MASDFAVSHTGRKRRGAEIVADRLAALKALGLDCDPIQILAEIATGKVVLPDKTVEEMLIQPETKDRVKAAAELMSYMHPKLKAVEVTGNDGNPITFVVTQDLGPLPNLQATPVIEGELLDPDPLTFQLASPDESDEAPLIDRGLRE